MMLAIAWILSVGLQCYAIVLMFGAYRWQYGVRAWRQGWALCLGAVLAVAIRRVAHLLKPEWVGAALASDDLEPWISATASGLLVGGLWRLSTVFRAPLPPLKTLEGHIQIDSFSVILAWDKGAEAIFGWSAPEAVGKTLMQTVIPPQAWEAHRTGIAHFLGAASDQRMLSRSYPVQARCKTEELLSVQMTITALPLEDGDWHFDGVIRRLIPL